MIKVLKTEGSLLLCDYCVRINLVWSKLHFKSLIRTR